jgi:hypothetical protein
MNTSQWSNVMTLNDSGRPIYNAQVPQNAGGSVAPTSVRGNVAGLDLFVTANTAAGTDTDGSILIVNPTSLHLLRVSNLRAPRRCNCKR